MTAGNTQQLVDRKVQQKWQPQINLIAKNGIESQHKSGLDGADSLVSLFRDYLAQGTHKLNALSHDLSQNFGIVNNWMRDNSSEPQINAHRAKDVPVPLLDLLALDNDPPELAATLGLAEDGTTVVHNFGSTDTPHLLIVGDRDAGKTVMLRSIAASLAINNRQSKLQLAAISPLTGDQAGQQDQAASWLPINYLPHMLCDVAFRHADTIDLLSFLRREITYREEFGFNEPRIILLVDQVDIVVSRGGKQCLENLQMLAQKGEDIGIHLAMTAQNVESAWFGPQMKVDVPVRLVGHQGTTAANQIAPWIEGLNSELLLGEGDFYVHYGNKTQRMQGAFVDDFDLHRTLSEMYRPRGILLANPLSTRVLLSKPGQNSLEHLKSIGMTLVAVPAAD